ncbi:hypothetical protein KZX50_09420 [Bacillus infantis]|uniref:hypothetical protein n=1 Tax=Bacillus infantis TaxID=324767 RepID=UPI000B9A94DE|nr:hypothetical protein [Bacillus infantis]MCK6205670.1 hypothetical protein [Bacillus infantis]OXT18234.1 hypothetical protein B9K06_06935 [Bacillus sp. OG2]
MFYIKLVMVVLFFLWIFAAVRKEYRKSPDEDKGEFWRDALGGGAGLMSAGLLLNFVNFLFFDEGLRNLSFCLVLAGMVNASLYIWKKSRKRSFMLLGMAAVGAAIYYWYYY